ncbi:MAG: hypothetical protein QXX19_02260 [Candidatus Caldarchaeum sp.]
MLSGVFKAPSSSANVGPGYDVFSIALEEPSLVVELRVDEGDEVVVKAKGRYASEISSNPENNSGARAAAALLASRGVRKRVEITYHAEIPPRKGLGSSGAEAAATVYGLNKLLKLGMTASQLVEAGALAEPGMHPDNVAASTMGGFVACLRDEDGLSVFRVDPPPDLAMMVLVPDVEKTSTSDARKAVPESVETMTHVELTARAAVAALALCKSDLDTFFRAVCLDPFVEYSRADAGVYGNGVDGRKLMEEKRWLLRKYNVAETISGAGPSRVLFYKLSENDQGVGERPVDKAVAEIVEKLGRNGYKLLEAFDTRPNNSGCVQTL